MNYQQAELPHLIDATNSIASETRNTFGQLTPAQLNWKPSAERWSVGQCFEHLLNSNKGYFPIVDSVLAEYGRFSKGRGAAAPTWLRELRARAAARFAAAGFPTVRQEAWRFTNVAPIADGAFRLAIETNKEIIPAVIFNTNKVLPLHKTFYFWPQQVEMHFLTAVPVNGKTVQQLKDEVHDIMKAYIVRHQ